jgi:hypothetical protein
MIEFRREGQKHDASARKPLTMPKTTYNLYVDIGLVERAPLQKIQVFLREDQKAALKNLSARTGVRQSDLVRRGVDLLLEERTARDDGWREATRAVAGIWRDHNVAATVGELRKAAKRRLSTIYDRN